MFRLFLQDPMERDKLRAVYNSWISSYGLIFAKKLTSTFILAYLVLLVYDAIEFGLPNSFSPVRLTGLSILFLNYVYIKYRSQFPKPMVICTPLLLPPLITMLSYIYFYGIASTDQQLTVFAGSLLTIFFCQFAVHRYWMENYILTAIGALGLVVASFIDPDSASTYTLLLMCLIFSTMTAILFRREFAENLYSKYSHLLRFLPERVAKVVAVAASSTDIEAQFKARRRFVACLCSDWRNFQQLFESKSSDEISKMFEAYYDLVFDRASECRSNVEYFIMWNADELFVTFYSEEDDHEQVKSEAFKFASILANEVSVEINKTFQGQIIFDIGLACGDGLLGLQGPRTQKKTTITGMVAGHAKRYETEAARIRKENHFVGYRPILVMDRDFETLASDTHFDDEWILNVTKAESKDIIGREIVIYRHYQTVSASLRKKGA